MAQIPAQKAAIDYMNQHTAFKLSARFSRRDNSNGTGRTLAAGEVESYLRLMSLGLSTRLSFGVCITPNLEPNSTDLLCLRGRTEMWLERL